MSEEDQSRESNPLRHMNAKEFVRRLHSYISHEPRESKYAILLGAGCSVSSGIPGASELVTQRWIPRLFEIRAPHDVSCSQWAEDEFGIIDGRLPTGGYGRVLVDLMPTLAQRQAEFEALCADRSPSFGYATLAQWIAATADSLNVILTTNFDDLVADAFYLFANTHPVVIQHGSLSPFIRSTRKKPMVVKLHGHHQFEPLNTEEETQRIDPSFVTGVSTLLQDRGLIVIGYGGNDEGVRQLLEALPASALPYGIYWVSGRQPTGPLLPWLASKDAFWVEQRDFDELMVHVRDIFGLEMPDENRIADVFEGLRGNYASLSAKVHERRGKTVGDSELLEAIGRVDRSVRDWALYEFRAQRFKQSDPGRAKSIYQEGLRELPDSVPLRGNFANLLKDSGELDEAEFQYLEALRLDPDQPNVLHDFAIFLWRVRESPDRAFEYVQRALQHEPGDDAVRIGNYANFMWEARREPEDAERLFRWAVNVPSTEPSPFSQFALFMLMERHDYRTADELFREALRRRSSDIAALVNYSHLAEVAGDIDAGLELLERAYAAHENNPAAAYALASYLWRHHLDSVRAQAIFERCLLFVPQNGRETNQHVSMLIDYARFYADERSAPEIGWRLLREARRLLPLDTGLIAESASFQAHQLGDFKSAIASIDGALREEGPNGGLIGVKAGIVLRFGLEGDVEQMYRRAVDLRPEVAAFKANLAGVLFLKGANDEGLELCKEVISRAGRSEPSLAVEVFFYLFLFGPMEDREVALSMLKWVLNDGDRSRNWDLVPWADLAILQGHTSERYLIALAEVIGGRREIGDLADWPEWQEATAPDLIPIEYLEPNRHGFRRL